MNMTFAFIAGGTVGVIMLAIVSAGRHDRGY